MVFFFRQEGWRLEHETPTDPSSRLVFKGVVFNEMKGVFVRKLLYALLISKKYIGNMYRDACMIYQ